MTRAIQIDKLKALCDTDIQILRVIALHIGEQDAANVNYTLIQKSLGIKDRDTVRKSVNRMVKKQVLKKEGGKLSIPNSVLI